LKKLVLIKLIHTLVWIFFNLVLAYLLFSVLTDKIDIWVWIGLGLFLLGGIILLISGMACPLTILARKYSDSTKDNFDIFLPNWLARYTKPIYTLLLAIVIAILIFRLTS
jgi:hypothetical protein